MAGRPHNRRKRRPVRQLVRWILVVTEGTQTEPVYVERLNSFLRSRGATASVNLVGVGKDPLRVIRKCIEHRDKAMADDKPYDSCVCLVDVDRHDALDGACELADREEIMLLISNLKFENWLRWHVEKSCSPLTSSQLDRLIAKLGLVKKKSLSSDFPVHKVHEACEAPRRADPEMKAGRIGPDPSSAMPILVDLLLGR